jgi:type IV secretory pathway TrbF-like protein
MSRNFLLLLVGVLTICAVGAGYLYYQERQSGIEIQIDEKGLTIEGN